ncbi:MAG TPA: sodium:proton exchanger [Propionibacteriaceae bacterium]|nr:sodium:proton exchanger [Propionibacteriaceae bacterium]
MDGVTRVIRPVLLCLALIAPAVLLRLSSVHLAAPMAMVIFGIGVVAASFVLAWAAEAAQIDISGGLAVAILAVIVVLPEYAVDLYFAYSAGERPEYVQFAAANMTGSNRLLLGLGWSAVVVVSLLVASRASGRPVRVLLLPERYRLELGFLLIAGVVALAIPISGQINLLLGAALLGFFAYYLIRVAHDDGTGEPDLVGPAARIAALPADRRRPLVIGMLVGSGLAILACAEPFAEALVGSGTALGVDQFLLVQWLAPLASEAPEFIVALLFAVRGRGVLALGVLISAKVNQWTLLIGSLPVAYLFGGGSTSLVLDARQVEEVLLTATQTLMGVAILLALRFPRWAAYTLFGLFAVQFVIPGLYGRLVISAVYAVIAVALLVVHRHQIIPTLTAPFRPMRPAPVAEPVPERATVGVH